MNAYLAEWGAHKIISHCAGVRAGERVLVLADGELLEVGQYLAGAARAAGAETVLSVLPPRRVDGDEPSQLVVESMLAADVILFPVVKDIAHSVALRQALEAGARAVSLAGFTPDQLYRGGLLADFEAELPACRAMGRRLGAASEAELLGPGGTELVLGLEGRPGNVHGCIAREPGAFTGVPNIEANIAPVEGTSEGRIVFDASVPNLGLGVLDDPIVLEVAGGSVTGVTGGREARFLERLWAEQDDPNVYNIAQLAVGMNPEIHEVTGSIVNDHGVYATAHIGIGTSTNLGGETKAATHFDGILFDAELRLDGETVLADGTFYLDE